MALIIRGECNVYPREADEVIDEHPAVGEATAMCILYDAVGEEQGTAADLYPLALQRTDTRNTFIAARRRHCDRCGQRRGLMTRATSLHSPTVTR
jgi:acyl-CoA synthetase (AMP-forming)/AMP-acid ligase II